MGKIDNEEYVAFDWEQAKIYAKLSEKAGEGLKFWKNLKEDENGYFCITFAELLEAFGDAGRGMLTNSFEDFLKGPVLIPTKYLKGCNFDGDLAQWDLLHSTCLVPLTETASSSVLAFLDRHHVVKEVSNGLFDMFPIHLFQIYDFMYRNPSDFSSSATALLTGPIMVPGENIEKYEVRNREGGSFGTR